MSAIGRLSTFFVRTPAASVGAVSVPPRVRRSVTPVRRRPNYDLSLAGSLYVLVVIFMYLAASNSQASLLFGLFGLMVGTMAVSMLISRTMLARLSVTRVAPEHATVGRPAVITYRFTNRKRFWPSLAVTLAELDGVEGFTVQPSTYLLHAAAGATSTITMPFVPKRRGVHSLKQYQLATSFPFGFIKRAVVRKHPDSIIVFPPLGRVDPHLLDLCSPGDKTGPSVRPRRGGEDEVYGLKEFRRGESPRRIYWRRSAKAGTLVAKEMTQVSPPRMMILVDSFLPGPSRAEHARVEHAIAMAASLAEWALEQGLAVGVLAWTGDWTILPPTRGKRQTREILAVLARIPVNTSQPTAAIIDRGLALNDRALSLVLFTPQAAGAGSGERLRNGLVTLSTESPAAGSWFRFEPTVDFAQCIPPEQEDDIPA